MSSCAIRLVFKVTQSASTTTGFDSCSTSRPGDVCAKIATIGSARNVSATTDAATHATANAALRMGLLLLGRGLDARQEPERDHLCLPRLAHHPVDEGLRVRLVRARGDDADAVLHLRLRPRRHLDH